MGIQKYILSFTFDKLDSLCYTTGCMKKKTQSASQADERLELLFRHAGLSEKQAKLYRLLLITGDERPSNLARKSGIKRANTYALLDDMARRGLVTKFEKEHITHFRPEPPKKLVDIIEARKKETAIAEDLAGDLLPNLTSQFQLAVGKPTITYYEGEKGIHDVFTDIYAPKSDPVYGCVDLEKADEAFPSHILNTLIPLRVKHGVFANSIVSDSAQSRAIHAEDATHLRTTTLVSKEAYPLPAEIDVYEDKIAMLSFEKGKFIGMIIQNQAFATTLKSIFKLATTASQRQPVGEHQTPR